MEPVTLRRFRYRNFRLHVDPQLDESWLTDLIDDPGRVPAAPHMPTRRSGFVNLPEGCPWSQAFVKWYAPTDAGHGSFSKRLAVHRLRPRYAAKEGGAAAIYTRNGIPAARVLAWGEEWKWGIRYRGILVQAALSGENVQTLLARTRDPEWVKKSFDLIIRIHRAGYTHGDANMVNFFSGSDGRIIPIDLENVRQVTDKKRSSDLVNVIKSAYTALEKDAEPFVEKGLFAYTAAGLKLPEKAGVLLEKARKKARKYGGVTL